MSNSAFRRPSGHLTVYTGALAGRILPLPAAPASLLLGRDPQAELAFDPVGDPMVSRRHARLEIRDGCIFLMDCRSRGGTWVDGRRIEAGLRLWGGEEVRLGEAGPVLRVTLAAPDLAVPETLLLGPQAAAPTVVCAPATVRGDAWAVGGIEETRRLPPPRSRRLSPVEELELEEDTTKPRRRPVSPGESTSPVPGVPWAGQALVGPPWVVALAAWWRERGVWVLLGVVTAALVWGVASVWRWGAGLSGG